MIISSTGAYYWDMYFVLKLLPVPLQFVAVDAREGTREYGILHTMKHYKHLQMVEESGMITEIASTATGLRFFRYLVNIGYGTVQTEGQGKEWIAQLEKEFYAKQKAI